MNMMPVKCFLGRHLSSPCAIITMFFLCHATLSSKKWCFRHLSALLVMSEDEKHPHCNTEEEEEMVLEGNTAFRK